MLNKMITLFKYIFLWMLGGSVYYLIEIIYRGHSHPSMFVVGGLCFICIGLINEIFTFNILFQYQVLIGDLMVLIIEFIAGLILNIWLGLHVWDYSNLPFNIFGQISLPFAFLWLPVVAFAIVVDDYVRYIFLKEEKPYYKFRKKKTGEGN